MAYHPKSFLAVLLVLALIIFNQLAIQGKNDKDPSISGEQLRLSVRKKFVIMDRKPTRPGPSPSTGNNRVPKPKPNPKPKPPTNSHGRKPSQWRKLPNSEN
ncbi:CEP1 [Striga asiatica]|uniref:CEP1 n=1 Tax=Striga asiatica TaxID=4170 RepID=A0A5A7R571_STRAF|nr:CEP1 [Striga asiatica]